MSDPRTHRSASADEALARIEDGIARARERAERATEFRGRYEELDAAGHSRPDGVRVTVDASSLVTAIAITDEGASRSGRQVAAAIMRAHGEALGRLRDDVERLATDAFGASSATTAALVDELGDQPGEEHDTPAQRSSW